jgi:hypothetical protein
MPAVLRIVILSLVVSSMDCCAGTVEHAHGSGAGSAGGIAHGL